MSSWSYKMQPAYTQQAYRQYPSTPSQNSGSGSPSRRRVSDYVTSGFTPGVVPSYDAQSYTTPDIYRDQTTGHTGPTFGNDAYGGGTISGYDFNPAMAESWGSPAFQPQHNSDYSMPSTSYSNLGQGETNDAGYHFSTDQVPGPTMNFSSYVPEASSNQGASPVWRLHNCWVSHAEQDELHLTIALKKT
ncbi:hypothetical protein DFH94DRAFT_749300 [Russula ochroleuca]|uniref:Uncharacterized protein n=1 Tax=Russula ochroleuca TaxID=152965 RepID=A0A9P5T6S4_9AGAM|nr:hypothetical protein DFH94DRAFT_749300 [Russula ochroleuca]